MGSFTTLLVATKSTLIAAFSMFQPLTVTSWPEARAISTLVFTPPFRLATFRVSFTPLCMTAYSEYRA